MPNQRILHVSLPAILLARSAFGVVGNTCTNDEHGSGQDTGCSPNEPICVNGSNQSPPFRENGVRCVRCLNDFESPMDPDMGCSDSEPLCVLDNDDDTHDGNKHSRKTREKDEDSSKRNRPSLGAAGDKCVAYPCLNTMALPIQIDEGCSRTHPICVDALGNDPPSGKPGVECISYQEQQEIIDSSSTDKTVTSDNSRRRPWGVTAEDEKQWNSIMQIGKPNLWNNALKYKGGCWTEPKAGKFSFCHGCPFSQKSSCNLGGKLSW